MKKQFSCSLQCGIVYVETEGYRCGDKYTIRITRQDDGSEDEPIEWDEVIIRYDGQNILTEALNPNGELNQVIHDGLAATIEYIWSKWDMANISYIFKGG